MSGCVYFTPNIYPYSFFPAFDEFEDGAGEHLMVATPAGIVAGAAGDPSPPEPFHGEDNGEAAAAV